MSTRAKPVTAMHALVPRFAKNAKLQTRLLIDALNIKYSCLPNHALRWQRVSEAAPPSKEIRVFN